MTGNRYFRVLNRHTVAAVLIAAGMLTCASEAVRAASIIIVALGTSNTFGRGVARGQTYPAQPQAMLKARGINARVIYEHGNDWIFIPPRTEVQFRTLT